MRLTRVFVDTPLAAGERRTLTGGAANHIARVLRLRLGAVVTLFDGTGGEYAGTIDEMHRDEVSVRVGRHQAHERESAFKLTLAQGISRGERMDWVVQKATELGVARIAPLFTERSVVNLDERQAAKKTQHWRSIAAAACEQSGRNRLPSIDPPVRLYEFLAAHAGTGLLLSPTATRGMADLPAPGDGVTVLIGPEGGLASPEEEAAGAARFVPVRMGPRILRTETAAVAALTLLQHRFGDL